MAQELRTALLNLGFLNSPLDPCVFALPKYNAKSPQPPGIHVILGIHVDDGLGGGDEIFAQVIDQLQKRFPFGSQRQQSFTFTGIQVEQECNGDIRMNQGEYSIDNSRERRKEPQTPATDKEIQALRGLINSLQYAASNTRPDLSRRLSLLQAKILNATTGDLLTANRLLEDAKKHADVQIRIQSIPPEQIRFMSFSDAAFASRDRAHSQRGTFILATTSTIDDSKESKSAPLVWRSKKIARVVSSTLASETYALSGALDQLSWVRLHWHWMRDLTTAWNKPDETLTKIHRHMQL